PIHILAVAGPACGVSGIPGLVPGSWCNHCRLLEDHPPLPVPCCLKQQGLPPGTGVATTPTCKQRRRTYMETQTVVVTGASAGIGRATARLFGERGDRVGLIARGQAGLDGAAKEVEQAGGTALAVSADVADYEQVTEAARLIEERLGPIDVWVNVAFASVFSPFTEITADEFRRVTEVSYLGFVYGTIAALSRMWPRNQGTIVQV